MIKIPGYVIFEVIGAVKEGGSLMTGVHQNLEQVLVFEDSFLEIWVIQVKINNISVRVIDSHGPKK